MLAIDVGGTDLKVGVLDTSGTMGPITRLNTPREGGTSADAIVSETARLARDLVDAGQAFDAIGLAVPGIVDEHRGVGIRSTNLGWQDFPFRDRVATATGYPVAVAHDVRAAGAAEFRLGAARGARDAAIVTIGTGIAAALIIDGRPYAGRGHAGELGHTVVDPRGPVCRCGRTGCLEAIASARAITDSYRQGSGDSTASAADVVQRAAAGDAVATFVWERAVSALTVGLVQLTALLAPEIIVIGGGLSQAGDALLLPLSEQLTASRRNDPVPTLARAVLGQDAGTWGAALAARDLLTDTTENRS